MSQVDKDKVISLVIKLSLLSAGLLIGGLCALLAPTPGPRSIDQLVRMEGTVGVETGTRMSRNRDYEYPVLVLGREKYHYLDWFPEAEKLPGRIRQGEPIAFWVDRENRWVWQIQTPSETVVTFAAVRKAVDQRQGFQKMAGFLMAFFGLCGAFYTAYKSQPLWPEGESSTPYNPNPKPKKKKRKKPNLNED